MTTPTYTLSDLEALRERCAKVAEACTSYDDNLQKSAGCSTSGERIARVIRLLPLTAPKPTIPEDAREEVALAIKHCFDTGKTRFDQITDAAIHTLISLGWKK